MPCVASLLCLCVPIRRLRQFDPLYTQLADIFHVFRYLYTVL